jgi:hypothetical protein
MEWIDIQEKTPKFDTVVFTSSDEKHVSLGYISKNKDQWVFIYPKWQNYRPETIIAWMPIPEAYENIKKESV